MTLTPRIESSSESPVGAEGITAASASMFQLDFFAPSTERMAPETSPEEEEEEEKGKEEEEEEKEEACGGCRETAVTKGLQTTQHRVRS